MSVIFKYSKPTYVDWFDRVRCRDKSIEAWWEDGELHSVDGPALVLYYESGFVKSVSWYRWGVLYRVDGPAFLEFDECEGVGCLYSFG